MLLKSSRSIENILKIEIKIYIISFTYILLGENLPFLEYIKKGSTFVRKNVSKK